MNATNAESEVTPKTERSCKTAMTGPWIVEIASPEGTEWFPLGRGQELTIGASPEADATVRDPLVSGKHLQLTVTETGIRAVDLGSKNGVYLGAARVPTALISGRRTTLIAGQSAVCVYAADREFAPPDRVKPIKGLTGDSPAMRTLASAIRRYAPLSAPVLVLGASGTGKDVVARALHELSNRMGPYVPLNMAALTETLADSELFGHEKGAFTGAMNKSPGAFATADRGTLFLDEIAELAPGLQAKLLRVVEDQVVRPVGSAKGRRVQVRVTSATWQPMENRIGAGQFREDLYHRISTVTLRIPPLQQRKGDIPSIARTLLDRYAPELGTKRLTSGATGRLLSYAWPGNVRELGSVLYRASVSAGPMRDIQACDIDGALPRLAKARGPMLSRQRARDVLNAHAGNMSAAARAANVPRSTFRGWLRSPA